MEGQRKLKEAFYRLARPFLSDSSPSDNALAGLFRSLQMPPSAFHRFCERACGKSVVEEAGASAWLRGMLEEALSDTWFVVPGQEGLVKTDLGSRPGDNLADLLFYFVFSEVLREMQGVVGNQCGRQSVPWSDKMQDCVMEVPPSSNGASVDLFDVTWMDDLCIMCAFNRADRVLPALANIAGCLIDLCLERGMIPNLSENKTEALLCLRGRGARRVRSQYLSESSPSILVESQHWPTARLRLVPSYRHLGGIVHHKGGLDREIASRAALAWSPFQRHRRSIFCHSHVPLTHKVIMFKTLVCSVLFHASGTWSELSARARGKLQRAYLNMCRAILSKHYSGDILHAGDDRVLALMLLPSVDCWLHYARLSYLGSFVKLDVRPLWALAHQEGSWQGLVRTSLQWLWSQIDGGATCGTWSEAWTGWCNDMRLHQRVWKRRLRFALDSAMRCEALKEGWQQCRGLSLRCLIAAGGTLQNWLDSPHSGLHACGPCQRFFRTKQAWSVHAFKVHGRVRMARRLLDGSHCPICLRCYASNVQLCHHVEHSIHCRRQLLAQGFACSPVPGQGSKAPDGSDFLGCAKQALGPRAPAAEHEGGDALSDFVPQASATWQALLAALRSEVSRISFAGLLERYRIALCTECLCTEDLLAVTAKWAAHVQHCDCDHFSVLGASWHTAVSVWLAHHFSIDWLCVSGEVQCGQVATFKQSCEGLAMLDFGQSCTRLPISCQASNCLLLCSQALLPCLQGSVGEDATCLHVEACLGNPGWCEQVYDFVCRTDGGLVVLCLADLQVSAELPALPVRARAFRQFRCLATLIQDVMLLCVQLWAREQPFVALLPVCDPVLCAALKQLPGTLWTTGGKLLLLHNICEPEVPEPLFHLLSN